MPSDAESSQGLYSKYEVYKDGEFVEDCFVLEPESDPAALAALEEYAHQTDDSELFADLIEWVHSIENGDSDDE